MFEKIKNWFKPKNVKVAEEALEMIKKYDEQHLADGNQAIYLSGYEFAEIIQHLLNPDNYPVIDTGNWENVNYIIAEQLCEDIKKNPLKWNKFRWPDFEL